MKQAGFILLVVCVLAGCNNINKVLKSNDIEYKYKKANEYYDKKKYSQAQQIFEDIFPFYKNRPEFKDIFYKFAYTYYYQKDYANAENLFKQYVDVFPKSDKVPEMDYMRAYMYYAQSPKPDLEQTNTIKAINMMQTFIANYPESPKVAEAANIIAKCREKLEIKDEKVAKLYYHMGHYRAAGVSYAAVLSNFPESARAEDYKLMVIKSYYQFAVLSVEEKQEERFEQVISECNDFADKFPDSKLQKEVDRYHELCKTNINNLKNEQTKKTTGS